MVGIFAVLILCHTSTQTAKPAPKPKPVIFVEADGFPSGHDTPEGIASDFTRAFINCDVNLFNSVCLTPSPKSDGAYAKFFHNKADEIRAEAKKSVHSPMGPKSIAKIYAFQYLTDHGQGSFGYAAYGWYEMGFVDVLVTRNDGTFGQLRTMVIQDRHKKWYVDPDPSADPMVSDGLNQEKHLDVDFSDVYTVKPMPKADPKNAPAPKKT